MTRIPGVCWLCLALILAVGPTLAQAPAPQAAPVQLVSVRSQKVLYGTAEPIVGAVTVKNTAKEAKAVTVSAWLEFNIDQTNKPQTMTLAVEPGKTAIATFTWKKGLGIYGHALKAEVALDGAKIAAGEDYFNVCDNFWNVALINGAGPGTAMAPDNIARMRNDYYNSLEIMFWAPDDFLGLTPETDSWLSGQARYAEVKTGVMDFPYWGKVYGLKDGIAEAHRYGIKVVTYAKLTGGGTYGLEMARRHPEWMWQYGGTLSVIRAVESKAKWDNRNEQRLPQGWLPVDYNMNDPEVVKIGIKSLCDSATLFGWDGARWDGNFDVQSQTYDLDGNQVDKLTADQVDARNAANMRMTKDYITKIHPQFRYGYNWTQGNWLQTMATTPRESIELCRGGGLIMNEYINQAAGVQHPLHRWEVYAPSVADDVEAIKKLGGYYGPILSSPHTADGIYTIIFAYAAGAHPYYHHLWGAFVTRNSAFIWDNALTRIHTPENIVQAPGSIWWRNWVFERPIDKTHKQLIIHLINPPAKPTVGEGQTAEDVPPPLKNIEVRIFPTLLNGWTPVRAARLSPEPAVREAVPLQAVEGIYKVTVPEVALWNILVIDMVKGGR